MIYEKSVGNLLSIDFETLLFVMRATDLQNDRAELAVLSAMLGLERELARIVGYKLFGRTEVRIKFLEFLGEDVMAGCSIVRMRALFRLRSLLAHGSWKDKKIGCELNNLLGGGPEKWLVLDRMSHEASGKVILQIIEALGDLARCGKSEKMIKFKELEPSVET
ncbi:MAG: hypothetical protein ACLPY5_04685 [Candidatus Bathyarchaeia archaeon]